jgi:hypothetical protein
MVRIGSLVVATRTLVDVDLNKKRKKTVFAVPGDKGKVYGSFKDGWAIVAFENAPHALEIMMGDDAKPFRSRSKK